MIRVDFVVEGGFLWKGMGEASKPQIVLFKPLTALMLAGVQGWGGGVLGWVSVDGQRSATGNRSCL